jgi:hypothetical protein
MKHVLILMTRRRDTLLNTLDNNVEPKILRRSSRIAPAPRPVAPAQPRIKTSLYKVSDFKPKILNAIPIVYPAIDINL